MFLKYLFFIIGIIIVLLVIKNLLQQIIIKYRLLKELKIKKQKEEAFRKKMKELEIK